MIPKDKDQEGSDYILLYATNQWHNFPKQIYPHVVNKWSFIYITDGGCPFLVNIPVIKLKE
jgi:hypothetical protein